MYRQIVTPLAASSSKAPQKTSSTTRSRGSFLLDKTAEESTIRSRNDKTNTDVVMFVYNQVSLMLYLYSTLPQYLYRITSFLSLSSL